jgi:hypothetical protein
MREAADNCRQPARSKMSDSHQNRIIPVNAMYCSCGLRVPRIAMMSEPSRPSRAYDAPPSPRPRMTKVRGRLGAFGARLLLKLEPSELI